MFVQIPVPDCLSSGQEEQVRGILGSGSNMVAVFSYQGGGERKQPDKREAGEPQSKRRRSRH